MFLRDNRKDRADMHRVNVMDEKELRIKAEKLSRKAGVSVEEAEATLKNCGYDMLDAYVALQAKYQNGAQAGQNNQWTQGTQQSQNGNGWGQQNTQNWQNGQNAQNGQGGPEVFSTEYGNAEYTGNQYQYQNQRYEQSYQQYQKSRSTSFGQAIGKAVGWFCDIIQKGMDNYFLIERKQMAPIRIPITVAILLLIFLNGFVLVGLIVGLFFGLRYSFAGPNINNQADDVNDILHNAGEKAQEFTNDIKDGFKNN